MIHLEYDPIYGTPIADGKVEETFQEILGAVQFYDCYSTENIFARVRLGVVRGEINHEKVQFVFGGERLSLTSWGSLDHWPDGFCDFNMKLAETHLRTSLGKLKEGG